MILPGARCRAQVRVLPVTVTESDPGPGPVGTVKPDQMSQPFRVSDSVNRSESRSSGTVPFRVSESGRNEQHPGPGARRSVRPVHRHRDGLRRLGRRAWVRLTDYGGRQDSERFKLALWTEPRSSRPQCHCGHSATGTVSLRVSLSGTVWPPIMCGSLPVRLTAWQAATTIESEPARDLGFIGSLPQSARAAAPPPPPPHGRAGPRAPGHPWYRVSGLPGPGRMLEGRRPAGPGARGPQGLCSRYRASDSVVTAGPADPSPFQVRLGFEKDSEA
jgi:hypothetical protein